MNNSKNMKIKSQGLITRLSRKELLNFKNNELLYAQFLHRELPIRFQSQLDIVEKINNESLISRYRDHLVKMKNIERPISSQHSPIFYNEIKRLTNNIKQDEIVSLKNANLMKLYLSSNILINNLLNNQSTIKMALKNIMNVLGMEIKLLNDNTLNKNLQYEPQLNSILTNLITELVPFNNRLNVYLLNNSKEDTIIKIFVPNNEIDSSKMRCDIVNSNSMFLVRNQMLLFHGDIQLDYLPNKGAFFYLFFNKNLNLQENL